MKVRTLRIHHDREEDEMDGTPHFDVFDREGDFYTEATKPFELMDLPKITRFGYCPEETDDVSLTFETPIDSSVILRALREGSRCSL